METDSKVQCPPTQYGDEDKVLSTETMEPVVLVLNDQMICADGAASRPLYQLGRIIASIKHTDSSVAFERVTENWNESDDDTPSSKPRHHHLFHLVHPVNAQYRSDVPGYYMTSASPEMVGNLKFETSKSKLRRADFTALLSANKSASDDPLFDEHDQQPLFSAKATWNGRYKWTDSERKPIAHEEEDGGQGKLLITQSMSRAKRDALVALWALRLWYDRSESRQAKREGRALFLARSNAVADFLAVLETLTPAQSYPSSKLSKRAGALGGVAAGGGC